MDILHCPNTHVIACDLDDTLVATNSRPEEVRQESDEALRRIGAFITELRARDDHQQHGKVYFGSATGRTFASVQELAAERPAFQEVFHMMDFHITSVGAALYTRNAETLDFARAPHWPSSALWSRAAIVDRLSALDELTPQEPAAQDTHKISYTSKSPEENSKHAIDIESYLAIAGLPADAIVSGSGLWRFVDIVPIGVNKGSALLQLPELLGADNALSESTVCRIAAGDSMNDQASLATADIAIIPRNGQPDLLQWAIETQPADAFYLASEQFAAGVLQGLQHHLGRRE